MTTTKKAPAKKAVAAPKETKPASRTVATVERDAKLLEILAESSDGLTMAEIQEHLALKSRYTVAYNTVRRLHYEGKIQKVRDGSRTPLWVLSSPSK